MAGTSWPALVAGARARAADVELKFDWMEGNIVPMTGGSATDAAYDLGTSAARWRSGYMSTRLNVPAIGLSDTSFLSFDATGTITAAIAIKGSAGVAINEFSSDGTLAGNSDLAVPTEKAVKTYVDNADFIGTSTADAFGAILLGVADGTAIHTLSITADGGVYQIMAWVWANFTSTATTPSANFEIVKDDSTITATDPVPGGVVTYRAANPNLTTTSAPIFLMGVMSLTSGGHTFYFKYSSTFMNQPSVSSFVIRRLGA